MTGGELLAMRVLTAGRLVWLEVMLAMEWSEVDMFMEFCSIPRASVPKPGKEVMTLGVSLLLPPPGPRSVPGGEEYIGSLITLSGNKEAEPPT